MSVSKKKVMYPILLIMLVTFMAAGVVAKWYVDQTLEMSAAEVQTALSAQRDRINEYLTALDTTSGTAIVNTVVTDCSSGDRRKLEILLSSLDAGVTGKDLVTLDSLYRQCGDYFAQRRSVMTLLLSREVAVYEELLRVYNGLKKEGAEYVTAHIAPYIEIAQMETRQSELYIELTTIQGDIIAELLIGQSQNAASVQALMTQAQEVKESMNVLNIEIDGVRPHLIEL